MPLRNQRLTTCTVERGGGESAQAAWSETQRVAGSGWAAGLPVPCPARPAAAAPTHPAAHLQAAVLGLQALLQLHVKREVHLLPCDMAHGLAGQVGRGNRAGMGSMCLPAPCPPS